MKGHLSPRIPRAPVAHVWRSPARDDAMMLAEIRDHAQSGRRVHVMRAGGGSFEIVANGTCFMVRTLGGEAVATHDNVMAAVMAGDRHLDQSGEDDFDDRPHPRGAA